RGSVGCFLRFPPFVASRLGAVDRSRGQGGAPAAKRGRTTLTPVRTAACWWGARRAEGDRSGHDCLQWTVGRRAACAMGSAPAPSLTWVPGPCLARSRDGRWGVPGDGARSLILSGTSTDVTVATGDWREPTAGIS